MIFFIFSSKNNQTLLWLIVCSHRVPQIFLNRLVENRANCVIAIVVSFPQPKQPGTLMWCTWHRQDSGVDQDYRFIGPHVSMCTRANRRQPVNILQWIYCCAQVSHDTYTVVNVERNWLSDNLEMRWDTTTTASPVIWPQSGIWMVITSKSANSLKIDKLSHSPHLFSVIDRLNMAITLAESFDSG